jgi:hypothetical protein
MHLIVAPVNGVVLNVCEPEDILKSGGYRGIDIVDHRRGIGFLSQPQGAKQHQDADTGNRARRFQPPKTH